MAREPIPDADGLWRFASIPRGMAAPAAGIDDTGQQGEVTRPLGRAGAVADLPQDHPMPQGAFGLVVGQQPKRVREDGKDRLPVVQEFDRERMRRGAGSAQALQQLSKRAAKPPPGTQAGGPRARSTTGHEKVLALSPCRRQYSACDRPLACQASMWFFQCVDEAIDQPRAKAKG